MTFDNEIILIGATGYTIDDVGNQIPVPVEKTILCGLKSVGRTEFYNAAVNDLKPERIFIIHGYEYGDEKKVKFEGKVYNVIRTFGEGFEEMELVCERVIANGS